MFIRRIIASIAYILILISVVEGDCKCKKACPNYDIYQVHLLCTRTFPHTVNLIAEKNSMLIGF
jgi:hypothetical protein